MTNYSDAELMAIIDRSLKATAVQFKPKKRRSKAKPASGHRRIRARRRKA